jgi:hypothetical protein
MLRICITDLLFLHFLFNPRSWLFTGKEPLLKDRKLKLDGGSNFLHLMATVDCRYWEFTLELSRSFE